MEILSRRGVRSYIRLPFPAAPLRNEFYRAIPVDQLKSVWDIRECLRRCRQGLVNRAVATGMRIVRLRMPIHFPANEEK